MNQPTNKPTPQSAFTLLEVLIVLFILGMLAAMAVPAMGILDDRERERITREKMAAIRRAVLGPDDRFDADGRPLIGGYVGDMGAWPDLWEARAEVKPGNETAWDTPSSLPSGMGQGPDFAMDPDEVFFRPSGHFVKGRWKWYRPYRKLSDDTTDNHDHIGGLETENEGQPRGLWTRFPEDLPFDIGAHAAPGLDLGANWKGPYLQPPIAENPSDSGHFAENTAAYENLSPKPRATPNPSPPPAWLSSWEDGDYSPSIGLGEHFDDREAFRILQTDGVLTDGWGRALRFFISADPDHAGSTIFWILSEGPDGEGTYPNKGTCGGHTWAVDAADTMAAAYDESALENQDNIVLKLYSRDWEAVLDERTQSLEAATDAILARIRRALVGESPGDPNSGYTGAFCAWPALFHWEDNGTADDAADDFWDDADADDNAYTKGQPRGLWTAAPNNTDSGDDLETSQWGLGWRHAFLNPPEETGADNLLTDAWNREILFFHDTTNGLWLVLSRGADGLLDFGDTDTLAADGTVGTDGTDDYLEPASFTEAVDVTSYDPTETRNADNRHIVVAASDWRPGFFQLFGFTVVNAYLGDATHGTTKVRFFRSGGTAVSGVDLLAPTALVEADGDLALDDWIQGDGTPGDPAFNYDDTTADTAVSGARYLVLWNDADDDDEIDSGENYHTIIYPVSVAPGSGQYDAITVDTDEFRALP